MATNLYCPNCGEDLGKDKENPKVTFCGYCGRRNIKNPEGYNPEDGEDELKEAE
jgi:DNA-directed RNA polymerase subunit RPC12/RpoP